MSATGPIARTARRRSRWVGVALAAACALGVASVEVSPAAGAGSSPGVTATDLKATEGAPFQGQVGTIRDEASKTSATCPASAGYKASINWGDGTAATGDVAFVSGPDADGLCTYSVSGDHTWSEEGSDTVTLTVDGGGFAQPQTATATATVSDAPLTATSSAQNATTAAAFSGVVAQFSDADPAGTPSDYTAGVGWGDGTSSPGTVSAAPGGGFTVSGAHTYARAGGVAVTVTITDAGGASAATSFEMTVADGSTVPPSPPTPQQTFQADLLLLTSPLGKTILGPEHDDPLTPTGPQFPTGLPEARLPRLTITAPRRPVRVGGLIHLTLRPSAPIRDIAWDLDGDGLRNDAYGRSVVVPATCPGRTRLRAEVVDAAGLHEGDAAVVKVSGSSAPKGLTSALARAPEARGPLTLGRRFGGWRTLGSAFGSRPSTARTIPAERTLRTDGNVGGDYASVGERVGQSGLGYASSWHAARGIRGLSVDAAGQTATGTLISPRFALRRTVSFQVGGHDASCRGRSAETATLYIQRGRRFMPIRGMSATAGDSESLRRVSFTVPRGDLGRIAVLVARDGSASGHINVAGLTSSTRALQALLAPVVGWADTHEHLDAHQGFGGLAGVRTYMGVPGGAESAYDPGFDPHASTSARTAAGVKYLDDVRDTPTHFGGHLGEVIMRLAHSFAGAPLIPAQLGAMFTAFHEQFHITEIHRAWEGGMRLVSSLAINNPALQYLMENPDATTHNTTITPGRLTIAAHVAAMRELAAENHDWMQIVYSPTQAHNVIASGKLAVVLGTEVDDLGSLGFPTPEDEVNWLWSIGIRQVTPIHSVDNAIGGAAIFQDVYDMTNDLVNRHDPSGNSTTQASTNDIVRSVDAHGVEAQTTANYPYTSLSNPAASYGFFFHTTTSDACSTALPRPSDCIGYTLSPEQNMVATKFDCLCYGRIFVDDPTPLVVGATLFPDDDLPNPPSVGWFDTVRTGPLPTAGANVEGLTQTGEQYIDDLEHHGMLVDMEHMSDASVADLLDDRPSSNPHAPRSPAWQFAPDGCTYGFDLSRPERPSPSCFNDAYPFMSSHTSFRNQSLDHSEIKDYKAREFERTEAQIDYIDRAGGTIAPVVLQDPVKSSDPDEPHRRHSYTDPTNPRLNDCAGSSKSFLQAYLWAINHTMNHRIALSTDMAVVGGTGARFTPPFDSVHSVLPGNCPASSANALAGLQSDPLSILSYLTQQNAIFNALRNGERTEEGIEHIDGLQYNHYAQTNPLVYSENPVTHAALRPDQPPVPDTLDIDGVSVPARTLGLAGTRDFNYTGLKTIGQLPDLIQDLIGDGIDPRDLAPLMNSAQSYLDMWNKAFRLNGCLDSNNLPTAVDEARCAGPSTPAPINASVVCANTCPDDPGDGALVDPAGHPFDYVSNARRHAARRRSSSGPARAGQRRSR